MTTSDPRDASAPDPRAPLREAFVEAHGWPRAALRPLTADASTRRYFRLVEGDRRAVLMDAPPAAETAACPPGATWEERIALGYNAQARLAGPEPRAFTGAAAWLRAQGLSAPDVSAADHIQGLLLLEDLGDDLFARVIEAGTPPRALYETAVDLLVHLHGREAPDRLAVEDGSHWPLLTYDALALRAEIDLFLDWYWTAATEASCVPSALRAAYHAAWDPVLASLENAQPVFVHRDYHAENLVWLPGRTGPARVGLLDFQDALRGPEAYDLVSLLTDARRDVEPWLAEAMLERYSAARLQGGMPFDDAAFRSAYAVVSAQRTAKILGIFARLCYRDGKLRYLGFMPRLWRSMDEALAHPALSSVAGWFSAHVPPDLRGNALAARGAPGRT
ncbi:MAG: aminoglycoside phosphotransferase family protein [Alphaproteobacteria bacterium]